MNFPPDFFFVLFTFTLEKLSILHTKKREKRGKRIWESDEEEVEVKNEENEVRIKI